MINCSVSFNLLVYTIKEVHAVNLLKNYIMQSLRLVTDEIPQEIFYNIGKHAIFYDIIFSSKTFMNAY